MADEYADFATEVAELEAQEKQIAARRKALAKLGDPKKKPVILDESGDIIDPGDGTEVDEPEEWPHQVIIFDNHEYEVRTPQPAASMAFLLINNAKRVPADAKVERQTAFFEKHLSAKSFLELMDRMGDPDEEFDVNAFMEAFVAGGTKRPIKRS